MLRDPGTSKSGKLWPNQAWKDKGGKWCYWSVNARAIGESSYLSGIQSLIGREGVEIDPDISFLLHFDFLPIDQIQLKQRIKAKPCDAVHKGHP